MYTFGSLKIEQGENIKYVQVQMGHSDIKATLDVYGHLLKDANPIAAARTDTLIFEEDHLLVRNNNLGSMLIFSLIPDDFAS